MHLIWVADSKNHTFQHLGHAGNAISELREPKFKDFRIALKKRKNRVPVTASDSQTKFGSENPEITFQKPGHPEKLYFGCPGTPEIDFSGMSGHPECDFWILRTRFSLCLISSTKEGVFWAVLTAFENPLVLAPGHPKS